ncbi:MAG: hypothetical protein HN948_02375 [Clostridia bacterium]|jgi:hypothetical protein|nr:hypothetical protein [Clostridia bacterium]MBT7121837.1 hypothetical protein [Clostridia bacterium]
MKHTRKILLLIALLLLISATLLGCNTIPEEYTVGVKLDSDYPEDDMPIIDDALVYFSDKDADEITVRYGTGEDLDDVADFYRDFFEENEIVLDDESDKSSRYTAKGSHSDFIFKLRASQPTADVEEQLFKTIVKIEIEFIDEPIVVPTDEKLIGFWRQETFDDGSGEMNTYDFGTGFEFTDDGKYNIYSTFEFFGTAGWSVVNENTLLITSIGGLQQRVNIVFEERDGIEYFVMLDPTGTLTFFRDSSEEFELYDENARVLDQQLSDAIVDKAWYYLGYYDEDGRKFGNDFGSFTCFADLSFVNTMNGVTETGGWHIANSTMYFHYQNESIGIQAWTIEMTSTADETYLHFYFINSDEYYYYGDRPKAVDASLVTDTAWYSTAYIDVDGFASAPPDPELLTLNQDGTFVNEFLSGKILTGTWYISDGFLYMVFDDDNLGTIFWLISVSKDNSVGVLKFFDMREENAGAYWEYVNRPIIDGFATFTSDDDIKSTILDLKWNELYYIYADGSTEGLEENSMSFFADRTFIDHYDGADHNGTWRIEDGNLYMYYTEYDEETYFPVFIEYDVVSRVLLLYLGDLEEGYEDCYWVFSTNLQ